MTDQYSNNPSDNLSFDPDRQGQGPTQSQGPTQGQGQGQYYDDSTNSGNLAASEIRSEGRGTTQWQGQGQTDPTLRDSYPDTLAGGGPPRATRQSADPDVDTRDPARGQFDDQARFSGVGGVQQYDQGQRRQGGQATGDNDTGGYGPFPGTGTGPGARPGDDEIRKDGGFGGKPPMTERLMGTAEKFVGKATGNANMYERGHQHKEGGY